MDLTILACAFGFSDHDSAVLAGYGVGVRFGWYPVGESEALRFERGYGGLLCVWLRIWNITASSESLNQIPELFAGIAPVSSRQDAVNYAQVAHNFPDLGAEACKLVLHAHYWIAHTLIAFRRARVLRLRCGLRHVGSLHGSAVDLH